MKRTEAYHIFVDTIWQWYARHKRELPWRDLEIPDQTQHAYQVLVSEIMLQQTQVSRVKLQYKNFLEQFPVLQHLAKASNGDMIMAWRGMGYNNRALRLRDAAKVILEKHGGVFPVEMNDLQALPGVGHYTAAAIRNFAYNLPTACLDTNIRRIYHRAFYGPEKQDGTWKFADSTLLKDAEVLLEIAGDGRNWHAALMDYGSLVCTKRSPKWDVCPLTKAGVMKAAYKVNVTESKKKKEPGRNVGAKFIPNRIFRGKVVEELRDERSGLSLPEIGQRICIDWNEAEHTAWLQGIIEALKKDHLVQTKGSKVLLMQ